MGVKEPYRWWWDARCAEPVNSWVFIKTELDDQDSSCMKAAKAICAMCPVLAQCRAQILNAERGLVRGESFGVIAGMAGYERAKITKVYCRQCRVAEKLPHIAFCADCREERFIRRYREAVSA